MDCCGQWEIVKGFTLISGIIFAVFSLIFHLYDKKTNH